MKPKSTRLVKGEKRNTKREGFCVWWGAKLNCCRLGLACAVEAAEGEPWGVGVCLFATRLTADSLPADWLDTEPVSN